MIHEVVMTKSRCIEIAWLADVPCLYRQARRGFKVGVDTEQCIGWLGGQPDTERTERFLDVDPAHWLNQMNIFVQENTAFDPTVRHQSRPPQDHQTHKRTGPRKVSRR